MTEDHYSQIMSYIGLKSVYDYGNGATRVQFNDDERHVARMLSDVHGGDEDTYDACFKSILRFYHNSRRN